MNKLFYIQENTVKQSVKPSYSVVASVSKTVLQWFRRAGPPLATTVKELEQWTVVKKACPLL